MPLAQQRYRNKLNRQPLADDDLFDIFDQRSNKLLNILHRLILYPKNFFLSLYTYLG
jgi:hypothetical protein